MERNYTIGLDDVLATNTVTDKKDKFSVDINDKKAYQYLSVEDQKYFEFLRNSLLEIFPNKNGKFESDAIASAENFAFINLNAINKIIDTKLEAFKNEITIMIAAAAASSDNTASED